MGRVSQVPWCSPVLPERGVPRQRGTARGVPASKRLQHPTSASTTAACVNLPRTARFGAAAPRAELTPGAGICTTLLYTRSSAPVPSKVAFAFPWARGVTKTTCSGLPIVQLEKLSRVGVGSLPPLPPPQVKETLGETGARTSVRFRAGAARNARAWTAAGPAQTAKTPSTRSPGVRQDQGGRAGGCRPSISRLRARPLRSFSQGFPGRNAFKSRQICCL